MYQELLRINLLDVLMPPKQYFLERNFPQHRRTHAGFADGCVEQTHRGLPESYTSNTASTVTEKKNAMVQVLWVIPEIHAEDAVIEPVDDELFLECVGGTIVKGNVALCCCDRYFLHVG